MMVKQCPLLELKDFDASFPTWCPGCGDFSLLQQYKKVFLELGIPPYKIVDVTGIGCSSKITEYHRGCGFHGCHGRSLPVALGVKLTSPKLVVIDSGGDGDGLAIGMEHFKHMCRRNPDIKYFIMNNQFYALTKGQTSPTSRQGLKTTTHPQGSIEIPVDACEEAILSGATFVARTFSGWPEHLRGVIKEALGHKGFAVIDNLSPCVTYHKEEGYENIYDWYWGQIQPTNVTRDLLENVLKKRSNLSLYNFAYDNSSSRELAIVMTKTIKQQGKLPVGVLFRKEGEPTFEELLGVDPENPIVDLDITNLTEIEKLKEEFR